MGRKVTRLCPLGNFNVFSFDLSAGVAANNGVDLFDIGFVATGAAGVGVSISYGTGSLGSVEGQPGSSLRNIAFYGGGWATGLAMTNCWHANVDGLYVYGNSSTYTTAPSVGLALTSCFNSTFDRVTTEFLNRGVTLRSCCGDSQGISLDFQMVECVEGVHAYGTPGGMLQAINIKGGWLIDNGNLNVPGHRSIVIDNGSDCLIGKGNGYQNGGDSQIIFNSCSNCKIDYQADLRYRANTTGPAIQDNAGTNNDLGSAPSSVLSAPAITTTVVTGAAPASKLINISTRGFVGIGFDVLIAGFVIAGTVPKTVLIRASGPALTAFGVPGVLPDPKLTLTTAAGVTLATNTVWGGSSQIASAAVSVGAFSWAATSKDSALLVTLAPGNYRDSGRCLW